MNIFTYHSENKLNIGDGVTAKLRNKILQGIVIKKVSKPVFKTNPVIEVFYQKILSEKQIQLFYYIIDYYLANPSRTINLFTPKNIEQINKDKYNQELSTVKLNFNPPNFKLNDTQLKILNFLHTKEDKIHLIHGITGSGKTILYLKRAEEVLKNNKQVLILVPEISLTPQTIQIFKNYFPAELISLYHSKLTPSQQLKEWIKIKNNQSRIIIGSRSSLFLPFQDLGLIVMDEEHDHAYKQEQNPRYHARTIVQWYHQNQNIQVILGSATPSLETFQAAEQNKKIIKHEILHRSQYQDLPNIKIVDLREEQKKGNPSSVSDTLYKAIQENLTKKEQCLILHNKRGFAHYLICTDCGASVNCPKCSISLTIHKTNNKDYLHCHYCDYKTNILVICQNCQGPNLKSVGSGIQKIFTELQKLFPSAKIQRVDSDTTSQKNSHQEVYDSLKQGDFDIVVGTQMIATGLDISNIGLVGVTNADIAINMPDFRSSERAFQLLTQVAGRTGRGDKKGQVIIQTYNPNHPVIQNIKDYNLTNFTNEELKFRKDFNYPPFSKLTKLTYSHKSQTQVKKEVDRIEQIFKLNKITFRSAPALIEKKNNKFYHHILITSLNPEKIISILKLTPDWWIDRDPINTI
jgi:primosomal protein N' (replication factor Y)